MARVASCPQCEHDLFVPDDAVPSALVKCPQCRAFFELQHAESREVPAALVVQLHNAPSGVTAVLTKIPTLDDFSSLATVNVDLGTIYENESKDETSDADILDIADEEPSAEQGAESLPTTRLADEPPVIKPSAITESHEEAAQRIDQWFRSAKTLSDVPPVHEGELAGRTSNEMLEPSSDTSDNAQVDLGNDEAASAEDAADFQLESPSDLPNDAAPWDDSQHMDRLLADVEEQPIDTYRTVGPETAASAHEEQEHFQPTGDWTPDESLSIPSAAGKPERKRSIVRMLVMSSVGGIVGLGLGYYALLWLGPVLHRGKEIDFLELAHYLPESVLPSAFHTEVKQIPDLPTSKTATDLATSKKAAKSEETMPADSVVAPAPTDSTAQSPVAPPEKQATFTTPSEPPKESADTDDRYAIPTAKSEPNLREPASLDTPPAKAIAESTPKAEPVRINNAPTFTADDVSKSLAAANAAEDGLIKGNLQGGKEVARTKGASYIAIADFARKATFADSADAAVSQQQADEFFRKLLAKAHARDEVAQIAPRWMSHPKRPQNGVFFAGSVKHIDILGSVIEYTVELSGGPSVVVVVPMIDRSESIGGPKGPIAVAGSIIDRPAADIPGYTGKAPQVVFAKKLLPLE